MYREMGCGFLEAVYQECLEKEFTDSNILFVTQKKLQLRYKNERLKQVYKPDFICYGKIIVEIKAVKALCDEHRAQIHKLFKSHRTQARYVGELWSLPKS